MKITKQQKLDQQNVNTLFLNMPNGNFASNSLKQIWGANTVARWVAAKLVVENDGLVTKPAKRS